MGSGANISNSRARGLRDVGGLRDQNTITAVANGCGVRLRDLGLFEIDPPFVAEYCTGSELAR
jgi:hypothetical protein